MSKERGKKQKLLKQKVTIIVPQTLLVWYMIMIEAGNRDFKGYHLPFTATMIDIRMKTIIQMLHFLLKM